MSAEEIIKIVEDNTAVGTDPKFTVWCEPPGTKLVKEYLEKNYIKKVNVTDTIHKIIKEFPKENNNHIALFLKKELGLK